MQRASQPENRDFVVACRRCYLAHALTFDHTTMSLMTHSSSCHYNNQQRNKKNSSNEPPDCYALQFSVSCTLLPRVTLAMPIVRVIAIGYKNPANSTLEKRTEA